MIESLQNEKIKYVSRLLSDNRFRRREGIFAVEGRQENQRAAHFGFVPQEYLLCPELYDGEIPEGKITEISSKIYEKLAYRSGTEGIIGLYREKDFKLNDFKPNENAAVIIVEGAEKPGNLGAILRSCEAFGIDGLIVTGEGTDFYNPNVIRSSVGCLFGMNFFSATNHEVLDFLKNNNFNIFSTFMSESAEDISKVRLTQRSAVVFGTEHSGLTDFWKQNAQNILIPMAGTIDSLNLSNAVAIACYEVLRQKKA